MSGPGKGKAEVEARVYIHYPTEGSGGTTNTHIDVESDTLNRIIRSGESTFAAGKDGGFFVGLKREMIDRAEGLDMKPVKKTTLNGFIDGRIDPFESVAGNRTHGSSEICRNIVAAARNTDDRNVLEKGLRRVLEDQGTMAQVRNLCVEILDSLEKGSDIREDLARWDDILVRESSDIAGALIDDWPPECRSVTTLSRSGTVISALKELARNDRLDEAAVLESRPLLEGSRAAAELSKEVENVRLLVDADVYRAAFETDVCVVGCDGYDEKNYVNKVGTRALQSAFEQAEKPLFVLCGVSKRVDDFQGFAEDLKKKDRRDPAELSPPSGVEALNRYFEIVPRGHAKYVGGKK